MPIVLKSGNLNLLEPSGPVQACNGIAFFFYLYLLLPLYKYLFRLVRRTIFIFVLQLAVHTFFATNLKNQTKCTSIHGRIVTAAANFTFTATRHALRSSQLTKAVFSLGTKRPGRKADHCPLSNAEVKNVCSHSSTPPTWLHDVPLNNAI